MLSFALNLTVIQMYISCVGRISLFEIIALELIMLTANSLILVFVDE